jgi:hypothetical protein
MIALAIEAAREGWPEQAPLSRSLITEYALDYGGRKITATDRPDGAMYAYFLNLASPLVRRWTERV